MVKGCGDGHPGIAVSQLYLINYGSFFRGLSSRLPSLSSTLKPISLSIVSSATPRLRRPCISFWFSRLCSRMFRMANTAHWLMTGKNIKESYCFAMWLSGCSCWFNAKKAHQKVSMIFRSLYMVKELPSTWLRQFYHPSGCKFNHCQSLYLGHGCTIYW